MKRIFVGTLIAFGVSALAFCAVALFANMARSMDNVWGSIDGVTPMWPVAVGFGAMNLMAISFALLVVLAIIGLVRDAFVKRRTR
jgi:hypothetical protein